MSLKGSEHVLKEILKVMKSMRDDLRELKEVQIETRDDLRELKEVQIETRDDLRETKDVQLKMRDDLIEMKSELSEIKAKVSDLDEGQDGVYTLLSDNLSKISSTLDDVHEAHHDTQMVGSNYYKEITYRTTKEIQEDIRDTLHQIRDNQSSSKPRSSADSNVSDETD